MALSGRSSGQISGTNDERVRNLTIARDKACIRYVVLAVTHFAEALVLDVKHVYQALPRLLSLWFDFTSIKIKSGYDSVLSQSDPELDGESNK